MVSSSLKIHFMKKFQDPVKKIPAANELTFRHGDKVVSMSQELKRNVKYIN